MSATADENKLREYARKLRWALSVLPEVDRESIVEETRSHVLDRVDAGSTMDEALAALGPPDKYAKAFRESHAIAEALSTRRTPHLLGALLQNVARSLGATAALALISVAWVVATLAVFMTVMKVVDPAHVGVWRGHHHIYIGIIDSSVVGRELLGLWIAPLALVFVVLAWMTTRALAVWALTRLAPQT
jgi:HAAS